MTERSGTGGGWGRRDLVLLVPWGVAGVLAVLGHGVAAATTAAVGAVLLAVRVVAGDRLHQWVGRVGRGAQAVLTAIALGAMWLVTVLPAWAAGRTRGRGNRRTAASTSRWAGAAASDRPRRPFSRPRRPVMSRRDRVLRFIGLVVVVVTLDATSGVAWKLFTRSELTAPVTSRLGLTRDGTFLDADAAGPALREYPWAGDHLRDMQRLPQSYWPFVLTRPDEFTSETVTVRGWARRTYRPEGIGTDRPLVALFGGSTAFGEGQRDEHTIASELARLAEEAGTPIRVVNYGQRSWSLWQEALLFEMLTGGDGGSERPDLAVFYDGANDMLHQLQPSTAGWPTHFNVDGVARTLTGAPPGGDSQGLQERTVAGDVADWYAERSTILRAYRGLRRVLGISDDRASDPTTDAPPEVVADNTADVYERGRAIVEDVAARRGIDTAFYWQPMPTDTGDAYTFATRQVGRPTVVIADALDDDQWVYFDDIHTNERGARLVAERMWETLGPQVRTLA